MSKAEQQQAEQINKDATKDLEAVSGQDGVDAVRKIADDLNKSGFTLAKATDADEPSEAEDGGDEQPDKDQAVEQPAEPESVPEDKPKQESIARAWAAAKKAQIENRRLQQEIKSLTESMQKLKADTDGFSKSLREDPVAFLEREGISIDDINQQVIDGRPPATAAIKNEARTQTDRISQLEKSHSELMNYIRNQEEQRAINAYKAEIKGLLGSEEYSLLSAYDDAVDEVVKHAINHNAETNEVLSPKDAVQHVQDALREQLARLSSHKAAQKVLGVTAETNGSSEATGTSAPKKSVGASTLSNDQAAASVAAPSGFDEWPEDKQLRWLAKQIPASALPGA